MEAIGWLFLFFAAVIGCTVLLVIAAVITYVRPNVWARLSFLAPVVIAVAIFIGLWLVVLRPFMEWLARY